ncbi:MAG: hypothetical protein HHAS10_08470 [Candidatus Altimarinota bacterium]
MNKNFFSLLIVMIRTPWRSISMFLVVIIISLSGLLLLTGEKNILRALEYYQYSPLDERRFTLSIDTDIFSLFSRDSKGIDPIVSKNLENDSEIESITRFTLVEIPVLAKFGMFTFSLETDMPIFAVSDNALTGSHTPMGISQILIDFYNKEFSGTSPFFPLFTKDMVLGQKVTLEFGKSKLFTFDSHSSTPLAGVITSIKNDYPGFGIMIQETQVKEKLSEIGVSLGNPYKIIGYMKDPSYKKELEKKYGTDFRLEFDEEAVKKLKEKAQAFRYIIRTLGIALASILIIIFGFLLSGYSRERSDVYRLFQMLGITGIRSRVFLLLEPVLLVAFGIIMGYILFRYIEKYILSSLAHMLLNQGIDFPLFVANPQSVLILSLFLFGVILILIFIEDILMRKKQWL